MPIELSTGCGQQPVEQSRCRDGPDDDAMETITVHNSIEVVANIKNNYGKRRLLVRVRNSWTCRRSYDQQYCSRRTHTLHVRKEKIFRAKRQEASKCKKSDCTCVGCSYRRPILQLPFGSARTWLSAANSEAENHSQLTRQQMSPRPLCTT